MYRKSNPGMRILHVLNDVTDRGNGIVNTAVDLAIEQARQGHAVAIAAAGGGYEELLAREGVQHFPLQQARRPLSLLHAITLYRRQILGFRPDVIHAHMRTGLLLSWLWGKVYGIPLVAHVHNVHDRESRLMGLAERVIAVSRSVAKTMEAEGIASGKLRVVLNRTLDGPRQPLLAQISGALLSRPAIVTVCGMNHRKGVPELISAFDLITDQHPDAHLYLVGDGPERALFEKQARTSRRADHIHFTGFQSVPQSYMLSADVFVLASRRESFGLVLIEARQAGCAIIASEIDGVAEALDGGRAGLLVPPQDVPALSAALHRMLSNPQERAEWRQKALQGVEAFRVEAMAREVETIYRELVLDPHRSAAARMAVPQ